MTEVVVTASNVDLSNCDREQIQFSGAVQPHGCMLVLEEASLRILQASANTSELLALPSDTLLGSSIEGVLGNRTPEIRARLEREALDNGPTTLPA